MIGYTSLGTNDLARSAAFYDGLLAELDAQRIFEETDFIVWSAGPNVPAFSVHVPFDGNTATVGNGTMIALAAGSRDQVDALYQKAIALGATSEGEPGQRHENGFYAAYFRDPDGNKLNIHHMG
ncbi:MULTISPECIES: VOC family protein [Thalassospira]|uniref:Glyoxalase n=1 Tax=Thalassospira profundimaris TaxID=502049 RepID=A0A367VFC6_9PROT|nr:MULTISPECIES: VOC family protein [Thalassospira]KZB70114.1 glyoxalase [Thalassospira sp. MCCC 1A01148]RCK23201.1 glyoxalase [Thalassospira profundimaris]HAI30981.1 VOC family protein [Thalassospira sp.]|tara:strand:+ start:18241 stop:18612 length:372 start_codon:yes stop_codon:yes gene_type:complete